MRLALCLLSLTGLMEVYLPAATIQYLITPLGAGSGQYRYNYFVSDVALAKNQEIDVRFDLTMFSALSNGVAGPGFDLMLFQPNSPLGASGDYSALAIVDQPSLAGPFRVDAKFTGLGTPGSQAFFINQYSDTGAFQRVVTSGVTTPFSNNTAPEPTTISLCCMAVLMGGVRWAVRRK